MLARRSSKRITVWVALVAVLMMAFAPLVSQAVGAGRAWQEICGVDGTRWVTAGDSSPAKPKPVAHLLDHCPYCSLHAGALGMPPSPLVALPVIAHRDVPSAFLSAPSTLFAWRSAQPRGPPFLG